MPHAARTKGNGGKQRSAQQVRQTNGGGVVCARARTCMDASSCIRQDQGVFRRTRCRACVRKWQKSKKQKAKSSVLPYLRYSLCGCQLERSVHGRNLRGYRSHACAGTSSASLVRLRHLQLPLSFLALPLASDAGFVRHGERRAGMQPQRLAARGVFCQRPTSALRTSMRLCRPESPRACLCLHPSWSPGRAAKRTASS